MKLKKRVRNAHGNQSRRIQATNRYLGLQVIYDSQRRGHKVSVRNQPTQKQPRYIDISRYLVVRGRQQEWGNLQFSSELGLRFNEAAVFTMDHVRVGK